MKFSRLGAGFLLSFLLAACQPGRTATPAPTVLVPSTALSSTPSGSVTRPGSQVITPEPLVTAVGSPELTLWVPPLFDPNSTKPAGNLLKARLDAFSQANPGVKIKIRVKPINGPGGLLESLISASAAAPASLPDLIALPREYLETAALKGLISPLEELSSLPDDPDWYAYARQLSQVQGSTFGLPFAADALAIVYRPAQLSKPPIDWETLTSQAVPLAFPGNDPAALFPLGLLLSAGDPLQDSQGRPALQQEFLVKMLTTLQDAGRKGVFPAWAYQLDDDTRAWNAYRDQGASAAVTWASRYLAERPPDTSLVPLPSLGDTPISLANGWAWALSTPNPDHQASSLRLAEYLVSSEFLANFCLAAGYLPPRPSALAAWEDRSLQAMLSQVELAAQAEPNYDLIGSLGPVVRDAVMQVLKDQADPTQTAQTASARLKGP